MTVVADTQTVIAGDEALAAFRQGLTGPQALSLLDRAGGRLLVQLPVGVGKTTWIIAIIRHALDAGLADLVVVLVQRWDILHEIRKRLSTKPRPVILTPRPSKRCGDLDEQWKKYEQMSCGHLGRLQLCAYCPRRGRCPWLGQYGMRLRGARLILATQAHLTVNPFFVAHLRQQTGATNPLVLVDESTFLLAPAEQVIRMTDLQRFIDAQHSLLGGGGKQSKTAAQWFDLSQLLKLAATGDLREGDWKFPLLYGKWAAAVQERGKDLYGNKFRFPGHDLHHFGYSEPSSREKLPDGNIRFAALPYLGRRFIIFTGSMAPLLARYRLDPNHARPTLSSPFTGLEFRHPGTCWFNIRSLDGAACYFPGNAVRIIDFFARKILQNILLGRRTLLVSRKKFVGRCRTLLRERLAAMGESNVLIATGNWDKYDLEDPRTIPLINYGLAGVNRFQHVESAYCLNGYFITAATLNQALQDIEPVAERYPVSIEITGQPKRRSARVELPDRREPLLPRLAEETLVQKEADVILQAVGRVRPFTRPREVITFYLGNLPGVCYSMEFTSLPQARQFFGFPNPMEARQASRGEQVRRCRAQGCTLMQIAEELCVSVSTVKRDLRPQRVIRHSNNLIKCEMTPCGRSQTAGKHG